MSVETRFVYNEQFRSIYAITPGIIMLALILIPTMLTALGVVRERRWAPSPISTPRRQA
jgi:ribosome-dependent ATPase